MQGESSGSVLWLCVHLFDIEMKAVYDYDYIATLGGFVCGLDCAMY